MKKYVNRYGDKFTFTENVDHDILWEGNFEFCRIGMPNDYTKAYEEYIKDNSYSDHCMTLKSLKKKYINMMMKLLVMIILSILLWLNV